MNTNKRFRIVPVYNNSEIVGYRIQERVTKCGLYIELSLLFQTQRNAIQYVKGL